MSNLFPVLVVEEHSPDRGLVPIDLEMLCAALAKRADALSVPSFSVTVVLTGDLTSSVVARGEAGFHVERLGGAVQGKTLPTTPDFANVTIVLDAARTDEDVPEALLRSLMRIRISIHEYGHAMLGRLRATARTRPVRSGKIQTPSEAAAIMAYQAGDEYWCDRFADDVLCGMSLRLGGEERLSLGEFDLIGDGYRDELVAALDTVVHPGWVDLVSAYRRHEVDLVLMYNRLLRETEQVLNLIAHADANAARQGGSIVDDLSGHPAFDLHVAPVWSLVREVLQRTDPIPSLAVFPEADRAVQAAGQRILEMWDSLDVRGSLVEEILDCQHNWIW